MEKVRKEPMTMTMEERMARAEEAIIYLRRWEEHQNGTMRDMSRDIGTISHEIQALNDKFSSHYKWLAGLALVWVFQLVFSIICNS
jgi:LAS superfamily LD-carboxypeptidase LdcB